MGSAESVCKQRLKTQEVRASLEFLVCDFLVLRMKHKGCREKSVVVGKKVIVAVRASKEISNSALIWTLTHVVQPGDRIRLLVVVPSNYSSNHLFLSLPFFVFKFTILFALAASWS